MDYKNESRTVKAVRGNLPRAFTPNMGSHHCCFFNAFGQVMGIFVSLYMNSFGYHIHAIGIAVATYGLGFFIGSACCGYLCEKYHPKDIISYSMLVNSIFVAAVVISQQFQFILSILALCGMSNSMVCPATIMLPKQLEQGKNCIRALGLQRPDINLG